MPVVTMRRRISGKRNGHDWPAPGETVEVTEDEARTLARLGLAIEATSSDEQPEESAESPSEEQSESAEAEAEDSADDVQSEDDAEPEAETDGYDDMSLAQLREAAKGEELSTSGTKAELVARLRGE